MIVIRNMRNKGAARRGLTLLELMLAMALSGLILYGVGMAVDLHLRTLEQRRGIIEQSRVARSIMRLISSDLKRVVTKYEQDLTALEAMGEGAATEALASLASAAAGGDAAGLANAIGEAASGGAGAGAGGDSTGGAGGESTGGAGAGGESTGGEPGMEEETEESPYTSDIAGATELPPNPGLYGNQYQLQLDISRLPRFDEFFQQTPTNIGELVDVVSDVKTVAYYVQTPQNAGVNAAQDVFKDQSVGGGLVRRQLDRTLTSFALANGNSSGLQQQAEIIAPEIMGLEFRYFDGLEWLLEWDSDLKGGLPMAVEIMVIVRPVTELNATPSQFSVDDEDSRDLLTYRMMVRLPTAKATFGNEEEAADLEAVGL